MLQYLKGTVGAGMTLGGECTVTGYSNADYGGDYDNCKSMGAYVFIIGTRAVSWATKKQNMTALSTTEAEYIALTQAMKEAVWLCLLINNLGGNLASVPILGDNQGSLALAHNLAFHNCTKHIDVQYHFMHEKILDGMISIELLSTKFMIVDALTKVLPQDQHMFLCSLMGISV